MLIGWCSHMTHQSPLCLLIGCQKFALVVCSVITLRTKNIKINNLLIIQYNKLNMENLKDLKGNNWHYKLNLHFYISLLCDVFFWGGVQISSCNFIYTCTCSYLIILIKISIHSSLNAFVKHLNNSQFISFKTQILVHRISPYI